MKGTRLPSGRSATASAPRTARFSFSAAAIGHSSWASGVPSGSNSFQLPHHLPAPRRRRAFARGERGSVGLEQLPAHAPFVVAEHRAPARHVHGGLVVIGNPAL